MLERLEDGTGGSASIHHDDHLHFGSDLFAVSIGHLAIVELFEGKLLNTLVTMAAVRGYIPFRPRRAESLR